MSVKGFNIKGTIEKYDYDALDNLPETIDEIMSQGVGPDSVISVSALNPNTADGDGAFATGMKNEASGDNAVAMGYNNLASGTASIAIGGQVSGKSRNQATQAGAIALGQSNQSSGYYSIAMGRESVSSGVGAVALGYRNTALGNGSFAAGGSTNADARCSAALGNGTHASGGNSLVAGKFNEIDDAAQDATTGERKFALIIGNGADDSNRSNAMTLDWDGNAVIAGKMTVGAAPVNNMDVATKQYVDEQSSQALIIADGSVSIPKLASDVVDTHPSYSYHQKLLFDMNDQTQLERGSYTNNVWTQSVSGNSYSTGYVDIEEYGFIYVRIGSSNRHFRWYDENKNFLADQYKNNGTQITTSIYSGARYFIADYSTNTSEFKLYVSEQEEEVKGKIIPEDFVTQKAVERTIEFGGAGVEHSFDIVPGKTYTLTKNRSNYQLFIKEYSPAYPSTHMSNKTITGYDATGTYTAPNWCNRIVLNFVSSQEGIGTITGPFVEDCYENEKLKLLGVNFTQEAFDTIADGLGISVGKDVDEVYYNCIKYGVLPGNEDNTAALNALITQVNAAGGGTIYVPCGTYNFSKDSSTDAMNGNARNNVYLKNNVSILGENLNNTIFALSGATQTGCSMFGYFSQNNNNQPLVGCVFSNFTVDLSGETMAQYTHKGKAFYVSGIKDCIFRDLRLISTPSTAMGIDMLDNVVLDSIYCYNCGNKWVEKGQPGGAAIGIGTGKWSNENYIIRNCVVDTCGHFGIFLEDQGMFSGSTPKPRNYSKGQIITNNIIRNGKNFGIGLRGGQNVLITGNNIYACKGGIYTDYGAKYAVFSNNLVQGCTGAAFEYGNESEDYACEDVVVMNNTFIGNGVGIKKTLTPTNPVEQNNVFIGNTTDNA